MKSRYHVCMALLPAFTVAGAPDTVVGSVEWLAQYLERAPTLHTCQGRRPEGVIACANPECAQYNVEGRQVRNMKWSADEPNVWRCEACDTVFPSATYPENDVEELDGLRFEYHLDPDRKRHYFSSIARWAKCYHAMAKARALGRAAAKGDTQAAATARDIVLAFAPVYEKWIYKLYGRRLMYAGYPERCNWGRFGIFADYDWPAVLCVLFKQLDTAGVIAEEHRAAYRRLIECMLENVSLPFTRQIRGLGNPMGQLWYDCVISARTFPKLKIHDLAYEKEFGNERLLSAPDLIHDCVEGRFGLNNLFANYFFSDGLCFERTPAYHSMTIVLVDRMFDSLEGYTDPPEYSPLVADWTPFREAAPQKTGTVARIYGVLSRMSYPSGHWLTVGDAQYLSGDLPPAELTEHHAGWGLSALRSGTGESTTVALLSSGSSLEGHTHVDHLNIAFFARGHEQVTDIGYPLSGDKIQNTYWRGSAVSHNTVVVDGRNQQRSDAGHLTAFADTPRFKIAQHQDLGPYPALEDYRRTLVLVSSGEENSPAHLIDVFHVLGGQTHDYLLHAQETSDESPEAVLSTHALEITPLAAPQSLLALTPGAVESEGYEHMRIIGRGAGPVPYEARWQTADDPQTVLRCMRLPESDEEVLIGRAPGYRHRHSGIHNSDRQLTKLVCRRTGERNALASTFVSVIEAHGRDPVLLDARRHAVSGNEANHPVAVAVRREGGTDIVVVARAPGPMTVDALELSTDARVAAVSLDAEGRVSAMTMVEGTSLRVGGRSLNAKRAAVTGTVLNHPTGLASTVFQEQDADIVTDIPAQDLGVGQRIYVDHRDSGHSVYTVAAVKAAPGGRSLITLDRPCRERIGRLGRLDDDGRTVVPDTGLPPPIPGETSCQRFAGMWVHMAGQRRRLRATLTDAYVFDEPFDAGSAGAGQIYQVTRLGPGDHIRVPTAVSLPPSGK